MHQNRSCNKMENKREMSLIQAIKVLERHNKWRLGGKGKMTDPKQLTEAIEAAINIMKGLKPKER
jgi:hypothetical protein